ncbi:MAG: bifunctional [glutamate--ammonia ligase]-adenylyl-L-tyrosine phosphorylase/[glutamate--ammonia-ligase] adenylyltransferase [Deltaproteobacteria bacterium]|nr:MAG: bifunctional [glutamate--ammonia ligase]-adenylyl-L-tyrosine phosphorylase/[glutamate--ammonia-ligase] adenylyltransferase [Deltaproteobacteria bacterium]
MDVGWYRGPVTSVRDAVVTAGPDPDAAAVRFDRLVAAGAVPASPSDAERAILAVACHRAPYLCALLARDPTRLARVAADPYLAREKPRDALAGQLAAWLAGGPPPPGVPPEPAVAPAAIDGADLAARLRGLRGDEIVRLGVREFAGGRGAEIGRELSRLAEVCFDAAIAHARAALVARHGEPRWRDADGARQPLSLAVIGMGKLGGEELNFCSDVDVLYVYDSDDGEAGDLSLHEFATRWCRRVTAALSDVTEDDIVFRVDLRLRPEGSRGPIANSLLSLERYYEAWGRPWERQAWLKARACAGNRALGERAIAMLEPFVYPRHISPSILDEVADLNRRIKAEIDSGGFERGFDVKNGIGGIREIEFFAQALQLIHAGRRPELRTRSTLATLDQLLFAGLITDAEQRALVDAYRLLRHVEHALQLDSGRQTQRLPSDPDELARFARRLDYPDAATFVADLRRHTAAVARLFATLGDDEPPPREIAVLLAPDATPDAVRDALAHLGFRDPEAAAHQLDYAKRKPASPLGPTARGAAARIAPDLLAEISACPDPDQALTFVADLIGKRGAWSALWQLFADNRSLMRLVVSLFGTSAYLGRQFVRHPELIDALVQTGRARSRRSGDELRAEVHRRLASLAPDDREAHWSALAEFKNEQVLRVGLADIAGDLDPLDVCAELTAIADVCLEAACRLVDEDMRRAYGAPPGPIAVLGLGKLGGRELGYASDLDIVFVYDGGDGTWPTRFAQRLVGALHALHPGGRLYEADTRLRPEGQKGLLVSSLDGWMRYHRDSAQLWERQALIKLRPVAGDAVLGARVRDAAHRAVWIDARDRPADIAAAIRDMRGRIERELGGGPDDIDIKAGRGGLIDVEFAAQAVQLAHGAAHPALRVTGTVPALRSAAATGALAPPLAEELIDAYRYLRALEHRLRIVHDRSEHRLPRDARERDALARRMGFADGNVLISDYRRRAEAVRAAFDAVLAAL